MKFTIQYVPLKKITNNQPVDVTDKIRYLRKVMLDCLYLLVVKKNKKEDSYQVLSGHSRLDFLSKHTNLKYVPCLIADQHANSSKAALLNKMNDNNSSSFQIIKRFIKEEPEYKSLNLFQKIKILMIGLNYKRTVISVMKSQVNQWK
ncbi:hypothetical protein [Aquibacillus salsiterrae]|uniref:ParB/Sulfiredoxin domain-containing protein n=1 Tax=Aquibacillus salsiterrae TaxID=2950439 RepID=A0A9X4ADN4_9BACI|nr:hypothetical protein [Aquibacillus salsiterrae]MDC3415464.1 hypothetical protein [Aquibacillus salsiterrae]